MMLRGMGLFIGSPNSAHGTVWEDLTVFSYWTPGLLGCKDTLHLNLEEMIFCACWLAALWTLAVRVGGYHCID